MIETPEIAIARLTLKPGDVLCVHMDRVVTQETAERVELYFLGRLPLGVKVAVLSKGIGLSVVTQQDIDDQAPALG